MSIQLKAEMLKSKPRVALVGLGLIVALAGCTRSTDPYAGNLGTSQASQITAAPRPAVKSTSLTPPAPSTPTTVVEQPKPVEVPNPTVETQVETPTVEVAKAEPSGKPVTRQAMVGAWTVSTGGSNCQIFLALTKWSGGYRAASRGCSARAISDVQAWDVRGTQVVLIDSSGSTAASLYRSAAERYDGSATSGGAISFSR